MVFTTNEPQWAIHAPKPIHPKAFELREVAISPRHFKLPYTAEVKLNPSPPLPEHHALSPSLNKPWAIPAANTIHPKTYKTTGEAISRRHAKPPQHTAKKKSHSSPQPPKHHSASGWEARSNVAIIREQDEQAADTRPGLVLPRSNRIEAVNRQGGQPYRPPHLRGNASTGLNRMPSSLPPHITSKNWRSSINP